MMLDALLALGLVLSTASQLRPSGSPVGPGELCLVIWIALMLTRKNALLHSRLTPALSRMIIFWILFTVALCLGSMTAFAISDIHDPNLFVHDVLAYPLLAAVCFLSTVQPDAGFDIHRAAWFLILFSVASFCIQLACGWGVIVISDIDPWYWERLRGLSENPNQLAIYCAVITFLSLHFVEHAAGNGKKIIAAVCVGLSMYVGRLTKSDTYGLILVTGLLLFVALKIRSWLLRRERGARSAIAGIIVVALPIIVAASVLFANLIELETLDIARGMAKGTTQETQDTANIRLESWGRAINRGIESSMLGLGPGPHIEIPSVLVAARQEEVEPRYIEHPQVNGTPNFEAHNTFLDLFTQGGLIAVLSLGWLIMSTLWLVYRTRLDALTVTIWSVTILSIFHLIIRHPMFWFAIAFALVAGTEIQKPGAGFARSK